MKSRVLLLQKILKTAALSLGGLVVMLGLGYSICLLRRPARTPMKSVLFEGVTYERQVFNEPQPRVFHIVTVDLTAPGIGFLVSPPRPSANLLPSHLADELPPGEGELELSADTVPGFLKRYQVQVAINGSYFFPHYVHSPVDFYPRVGDGASVVGIGIANGDRYSAAQEGWAALCVISPRDIRITEQDCPPQTQQAIAGDIQFVKDAQLYKGGLVLLKDNATKSMPRTVIAVDKNTTRLWMVIVDGRQEFYSEGITLAELGEFLIKQGADRAINLDGGGSSALAVERQGRAAVLNSSIQARIPTNQRPVANHFGLYANPLPAEP
jgi:hypothetical protein